MRQPCSISTRYDYNNPLPDGQPRPYFQCYTHNVRLVAGPEQTSGMIPAKCEVGAIEDTVDARFEHLEARVKALEDKQK
jgi:hypothetical protein